MSKYTKAQRHSIYCIMLAEAEKPSLLSRLGNPSTKYGLCFLYETITYTVEMFECLGNGPVDFPEIWERKPKKAGDYFFPTTKKGWEKRKQLLRECIEETDDF